MAFYFVSRYPSFRCSFSCKVFWSHCKKCALSITPFKYVCSVKKLTQSCYFLKSCPLCHGPKRWAPASCCMAHQGPTHLRVALETLSLLYSSCFGGAVTAAQACCSFKVVLFMLVPAFLFPEDDLSFPVFFPFSASVPPKPCKCGILLQHEKVRTPPIKLYHDYTKNCREGKDGRDEFDQEKNM